MKCIKDILLLIKRDLRCSKKDIVIKFSIFFFVFVLWELLYIYYYGDREIINPYSMLFRFFKGCEYIDINNLKNGLFIFPMDWLIVVSFILYAVGDYFHNDIKTNGRYVLIRVKKLGYMFLSKIIWAVLITILYYLILIALTIIIGFIFLSHPCSFKEVFFIAYNVFILYLGTSISMVVMLIFLTLIMEPVYSFFTVIFIYTLSIFLKSPLMPGQHGILLRHIPFTDIYNLTLGYSVIYNMIITIILVVAGMFLSSKKEIY